MSKRSATGWLTGSDYKRLGAIVVTDEIPKNPSGKILRRVLREVDADRP